MAPRNRALLKRRDELQQAVDEWHSQHAGEQFDGGSCREFLERIGYIVPEGEPFEIQTEDVDPETTAIPGAQLVVPVTNARYALIAANAHWGSLHDALYG